MNPWQVPGDVFTGKSFLFGQSRLRSAPGRVHLHCQKSSVVRSGLFAGNFAPRGASIVLLGISPIVEKSST